MGYSDLYLAHRVELVDYATAIVGDRARGEDVVQEAFLRLDAATAGRTLDEPVGYLRRIIRTLRSTGYAAAPSRAGMSPMPGTSRVSRKTARHKRMFSPIATSCAS